MNILLYMCESTFEKVKHIVNIIDPKIKLLNISNTFNLKTGSNYMNSILNKKNVMLFIEKNNITNFVFECSISDIMLCYNDEFIRAPLNFDENTVRIGIMKMINGDNTICTICYENTIHTIACTQCFSPFCHNCTLKLLKNYDNVVIENKITKLKCPSCNEHKIVLDILFEK